MFDGHGHGDRSGLSPNASNVIGREGAGFSDVLCDVSSYVSLRADPFDAGASGQVVGVFGSNDLSPSLSEMLMSPAIEIENEQMKVRGFLLRVFQFPDQRRIRRHPSDALDQGVEVFRVKRAYRIGRRVGQSQKESVGENRF